MTQAPSVQLSELMQVAMRVGDIDRATAFYRDVLGAKHLFQAGNLSFFDLNGVRLLLDIPEDAAYDHPGSILYFRVPNVREAYDALKARDVQFVAEPHIVHKDERHELWMAFFEDGEGNTLAVAAEVPLAA
ncbi:MAG: VOC family protein [Dehalococcoidia bacterium]|nr:VOC family protein [Dehalococcoidia bacterium]